MRKRCRRCYIKRRRPFEVRIDNDALAKSFVSEFKNASEKEFENKKLNEKLEQEKLLKQWGISSNNAFLRTLQYVLFVLKFPFIKRKTINDERATKLLSKMIIIAILTPFKIAFASAAIVFFLMILNFFKFNTWSLVNLYMTAPLVFCWIMYGLLRMSIIEVDKMKDGQMLMAILSAITSFVAMVIAIIALFTRG